MGEKKYKWKPTPANKAAVNKYKKDKVKHANISFFPADYDLYDRYCAQPQKNEYIRNLIRADMAGCVDWDRFNGKEAE